MQTSLRGMIEIACLEGVSTQVYYDSVGVKTIGIGATVSEIPLINDWPLTDALSISDIFSLFKTSLGKYEDAVNSAIKAEITQQEFDSLVSLAYNIGCGGLKRSTLVKRVNAGDSMLNIRQAFLMWNKPKEILGRRLKEALLFTTGEYQTSGNALLYDTQGTGRIKKYKTINIFDYLT